MINLDPKISAIFEKITFAIIWILIYIGIVALGLASLVAKNSREIIGVFDERYIK